MKKVLLLLCLIAGIDSVAQVEITGFYGYRVGGSFYGSYKNTNFFGGDEFGTFRINDSQSFGASLDYQLNPGFAVSVEWYGQDTDVDFRGNNDIKDVTDIWINYFTINGIYEKEVGHITPFGGIGLGVATASTSDPTIDTRGFFAANLQAGVKISLTERVSLKFKAAMLMPLQFGSGGVFCGTGSGCSVGVGASSTILQGDFSGGVVLKLGDTGGTPHHNSSPSSKPTW